MTATARERTVAALAAGMALAAVQREYPSQVVHLLHADADARPPRELTPAFHGSFDWHSAVHGHWCLARLARLYPGASFAPAARAALESSLNPRRIAGEVTYLSAPGRLGFERPYGLAWLLQLGAELAQWEDADARRWRAALGPLEALAVERLSDWLPRLGWPIRSGEHSQTAFAMGLALDWARVAGAADFAALLCSRARDFHLADRDAPISYEPSGHDFLSPVLGEADLMRRVLPGDEFAAWLQGFLPALDGAAARRWLAPVGGGDPSDGKLAHLTGLNLSRAWMLEGVAAALTAGDPRVQALAAAAERHAARSLGGLSSEHYSLSHWIGSFAVYFVTRRGLDAGTRA